MTSRVVPASAETMAASRRASAFKQARLADVGCTNERHPEPIAHDLAAMTIIEVMVHRAHQHLDDRHARRPSSSGADVGFIREVETRFHQSERLRQLTRAILHRERTAVPVACSRACRRCASVSASMRSERPSTSARSSLPFSKARRANSPGSAKRQFGIERQRIQNRHRHRPPAMDLKLHHILAGEALRRREPQHHAAIDHLARLGVTDGASTRHPRCGSGTRHEINRRPGAVTRNCGSRATPARPAALERAKIVASGIRRS